MLELPLNNPESAMFEIPSPAGVTWRTDPGEIWRERAHHRFTSLPWQICRWSMKRVGMWAPNIPADNKIYCKTRVRE